jgi:hypothetical protein
MMKPVLSLALACGFVVACSQQAPQSTAAGQPAPSASPSPVNDQTQAAPPKPADSAKPSQLSSTSAAAPPASTAAPAAPTVREVTIPAGTTLSVRILNALASDSSKVEDSVRGSLAKAVAVDDTTALPSGTQLNGSVLEANESGRVKGRASIAFRFDRMTANGETLRIQTATVRREAAPDRKSDITKGGIGAGVGAIVGGVVGGGKGAAIGAAAGGTGAVLATKGKEVSIPSGTVVSVRLEDPITVSVPVK